MSEKIGVSISEAKLCPCTLSTKEENIQEKTRRPRRKNRTFSQYSTTDIAKLLKLMYPVKN